MSLSTLASIRQDQTTCNSKFVLWSCLACKVSATVPFECRLACQVNVAGLGSNVGLIEMVGSEPHMLQHPLGAGLAIFESDTAACDANLLQVDTSWTLNVFDGSFTQPRPHQEFQTALHKPGIERRRQLRQLHRCNGRGPSKIAASWICVQEGGASSCLRSASHSNAIDAIDAVTSASFIPVGIQARAAGLS